MQVVDYIVIVLYILGIVGAGMVFAGRMKDSKEMFAAGGQSPWWVSGLSGFMTMFSAGTFVVWGGIAYQYGFVAVAINMCYGLAALLVGYFVAGRWRKLGVSSAAEFLQMRFGGSVVQFYTWFKGGIGIFGMGGTVYALSKIICALMPLPEDHVLADPATGMLSVPFTSVTLCIMVILITFSGGLWAVLMTDVLQFVILVVSVVFVVPLILGEAGGWGNFVATAPEGFMKPVAGDFSWWFLAGWVVIHFFKIGGEWPFVQRYTCVPTAKDARKSACLFGVLYLISPLFWMLPPLVFRTIQPDVDAEQAYILACKTVLPAGMMGLMVAAMASATASMATTMLNVFAGAFTTEVYHRLFNRDASDKQLVLMGRVFTVVLGLFVIAGALLIPRYGYTRFVIDITTLLTGPLVLPTIWGLFSKKIGLKAFWVTVVVGFSAAALVKFGLGENGFLAGVGFLEGAMDWIAANKRLTDLTVGIMVPFFLLVILELVERHEYPGWTRAMELKRAFKEAPPAKTSNLPAQMVAITLVIIATAMLLLALIDRESRMVLVTFAMTLFTVTGVILFVIWNGRKK